MKIGFVGLAGAGKDTAAEILAAGIGYKIDRFAAPLKAAAELVFGPDFDKREVKEVPVHITLGLFDDMMDAAFACSYALFGDDQAKLNSAGVLFDRVFAVYDPMRLEPVEFISPRTFQQLLGTEVMRQVKDSCFRDRLFTLDNVLIPDVRFANELDVCDKVFLIVREGQPVPDVTKVHVSEVLAVVNTKAFNEGARQVTPNLCGVINPEGDVEQFRKNLMRAYAEC